jgi:hypothetical protein
MGSTGKGFRYPQYSDTPDIPRDLSYLADDVDAYLDAHPGPQGTTGTQGTNGAQGITGTQGALGTQGETGAQGTVGAQGTIGAQGTFGTQGTQGTLGTQGSTGSGAQGAQGSTGAQGTTGTQGTIGSTGPEGPATVPQNSQTSSYTLISSDNGKFISITTGGVTVPSSVFTAGQNVVIYNNSSSSQTITQGSGVTMRFASFTTTGNRTIPRYGLATILCVDTNTFVISGPGLS